MLSKHLLIRMFIACLLVPIAVAFKLAQKSGDLSLPWLLIGFIAVPLLFWLALIFFDKIHVTEKAKAHGWTRIRISTDFPRYLLQFFGLQKVDRRGYYNVVYQNAENQMRYASCKISWFCRLEWLYLDAPAER